MRGTILVASVWSAAVWLNIKSAPEDRAGEGERIIRADYPSYCPDSNG
jgi:hypothetical protein